MASRAEATDDWNKGGDPDKGGHQQDKKRVDHGGDDGVGLRESPA